MCFLQCVRCKDRSSRTTDSECKTMGSVENSRNKRDQSKEMMHHRSQTRHVANEETQKQSYHFDGELQQIH